MEETSKICEKLSEINLSKDNNIDKLKLLEKLYSIEKLPFKAIKEKKNQDNLLILSIQKNRTGLQLTLIIDLQDEKIYPHYPNPVQKKDIIEIKENDIYFLYSEVKKLDPKIYEQSSKNNKIEFPCCKSIKPYKDKRSYNQVEFDKFLYSQGSSDTIFEVKKQIQRGAAQGECKYVIENGKRHVWEYSQKEIPIFKEQSYKNFTCGPHNLFFEVNCYKIQQEYQYHHMRLRQYTDLAKIQEIIDLLDKEFN